MDMAQYLDIFLEEGREHLENMSQRLVELEKAPGNLAILNEVFRSAHTLKGMSSTMGFEDMADLTHHMENVLEDLKEGTLPVNTFVVDVLLKCLDRLQLMVDDIKEGGSGSIENRDVIGMLNAIKNGLDEPLKTEGAAMAEPVTGPGEDTPGPQGTMLQALNEYELAVLQEAFARRLNAYYIKILVAPDCLMKQVRAFMVFKALEEDGDIIKSDPPAQDLDEGRFGDQFELILVTRVEEETIVLRMNEISEISIGEIKKLDDGIFPKTAVRPLEVAAREKPDHVVESGQRPEVTRIQRIRQTVRVDIERLDNLMNLVGELVISKGRLEQIGATRKLAELNETVEQIDRITTDLQNVVMKVRMVPIKQVFNRFPRMVRDLAHELNKEINFIIEGEETELDRTVIDEIGDPLMHLLRNALDHGIENPKERQRLGKPSTGTVRLSARHEGNHVIIEVTDDGQGIRPDKVRQKAVEKGLASQREADQMTEEAVTALLFTPGFSTATDVTDVSGRGVGLDVVKNKIEALNGEISVDSKPGVGTVFQIRLPLTLAIIQALLVAVGDETYAIPLGSVDETTMLARDEIKMVQNQEVALLRGNILPLARLHQLLEVPGVPVSEDTTYVVVVRKADRQLGLICDNLIGQQDIVISSLGKLLAGINGLAGATILGDGQVALILDVGTLM